METPWRPADQSPQTERSFVLQSLSFTELWALCAAILYALGFVVANTHLARYELVRFDLLRGRYVAAALLLAFCFLFPALGGFHIGTEYRKSEPKPRWERQRFAAIKVVLATVIATLVVRVLLLDVTVGGAPWTGLITFFFSSIALAAIVGSGVAKFMRFGNGPLHTRGASPERIIGVLLILVWLAGIFGRWVYPYISPSYGGGAAVLAEVSIDSSVVPTHLRAIVSRPVVVLDRSERDINLLGCLDSSTAKVRPILLPVTAVHSVVIERAIAAPVAGISLCRLTAK